MFTIAEEIASDLDQIRAAGLFKAERTITTPQSAHIATDLGECLNFCANNYLGLADHPDVTSAAKAGLDARVNALRLGADDFIQKPFENEEVLARVEAQLRRCRLFSPAQQSHRLHIGRLMLDSETMEAQANGRKLALTAREFAILELMMRYPRRVFTRENLYEQIWGEPYYGEDNTVNVHISNLRAKLHKADPKGEYIKTVWGIGFKMAQED